MDRTINYAGAQQVYDKDQVLQKIADEAKERADADSAIRSSISLEITDRVSGDNTNAQDIQAEARKREEDDNTLDGKINTNTTSIQHEVAKRKEAILKVEEDISKTKSDLLSSVSDLDSRITAEHNRIIAEENRRLEDDNAIIKRINDERAERIANDTALDAKIHQLDPGNVLERIDAIETKIPTQASEENKLADKAFVNSSVQTATANFRGEFTDWNAVPLTPDGYNEDYAGSRKPTTNDYMVVREYNNDGTWRFKYTGRWEDLGKEGWKPEYQVNETPLTAEQITALNSGITETLVAKITELEQKILKCHPIGYVYTQWPNELSPVELGLEGTWEDISSTKAGLFIRVLGGDSEAFGVVQGEELPNIRGSFSVRKSHYSDTYKLILNEKGAFSAGPTDTEIAADDSWYQQNVDRRPTIKLFNAADGETLDTGEYKPDIMPRIYKDGGHVVPKNTAIKVWKRTA